ncbi:MAG: phosphatidylglycerol lysyltransferase domain-containing protein [Candidatus Omnitrophica bacterium]|nr:phosphatidylglycerol lysyltransferase domain-containing protein [Candidatus Omnitrophota bacterium]
MEQKTENFLLDECANCDVCCRFLDLETPLAPVGRRLAGYKDRFICGDFDPAKNECRDYDKRPLDCRIYPFVVMWDKNYKNIVLGVDTKCPYIEKSETNSKFQKYKNYLLTVLKKIDAKYVLRFQDDVEILERFDIKTPPSLNRFLIGDKALFEKYLNKADKPFSSYSFAANYVWTGMLDYYWIITDNCFCLFCKTRNTFFMPIMPLGKELKEKTIRACFKLMSSLNKNKACSRIEDIPEGSTGFFESLGYKIKEKGREYICSQKDLTALAGDGYKAKRALRNYFLKNNRGFEYREFRGQDAKECVELFKHWSRERAKAHKDNYYKALLEDSFGAHKKAMERFRDLDFLGRVVKVDGRIAAYTFGYPLGNGTFVILFEVADLGIKGLAQFIFREFCAESGAEYINLMDDSGLENLRKVKLSYHPAREERMFSAYE